MLHNGLGRNVEIFTERLTIHINSSILRMCKGIHRVSRIVLPNLNIMFFKIKTEDKILFQLFI